MTALNLNSALLPTLLAFEATLPSALRSQFKVATDRSGAIHLTIEGHSVTIAAHATVQDLAMALVPFVPLVEAAIAGSSASSTAAGHAVTTATTTAATTQSHAASTVTAAATPVVTAATPVGKTVAAVSTPVAAHTTVTTTTVATTHVTASHVTVSAAHAATDDYGVSDALSHLTIGHDPHHI